MSTEDLCCPMCAAELTIEQLFAHAETRQAFARLAALSLPLGGRVLAYVGLFAPTKNRMTLARKVKVMEQLLPDLARGVIERKGREWCVTADDWGLAIDQMLAARDAGKIALPLTGHGYLYEILCGLADKAEARAERELERQRKAQSAAPTHVSTPIQDVTTSPPSPAPVMADPAHAQRARALLATLRRKPDSPNDQEEVSS